MTKAWITTNRNYKPQKYPQNLVLDWNTRDKIGPAKGQEVFKNSVDQLDADSVQDLAEIYAGLDENLKQFNIDFCRE